MTVHLLGNQAVPQFVGCLKVLPNLHTLEIGSAEGDPDPVLLKKALGWIKLPQIKALIIPESAHPILKHCRNVEDVVYVIADKPVTSDEFLRSLTSSRGSKVKRLAIPIAFPGNPSSE